MTRPKPDRSAAALLPGEAISAVGVFGVQDRLLASGLAGVDAADAVVRQLVSAAPQKSGQQQYAVVMVTDQLAVSVLVAVCSEHVHICDWDQHRGATNQLARFDRAATTSTVAESGTFRRLVLTDLRSGYRLPLTATVSRLSPFGSGARQVLRQLAATAE